MSDQTKPLNKETLIEEMDIDVYSSKRTGEISVFHGKPLRKPLEYVEFDKDTYELFFIYSDEKQEFGVPMKDTMLEHFLNSEKLGVFHLDLDNNKVLGGFFAELRIISTRT